MRLTAQDIATLVNGRLSGNGQLVLTGAAGLEESTESDISFLKELKGNSLSLFSKSKAGLIFVPDGFSSAERKTVVEVKNPLSSFAVVLGLLDQEKKATIPSVHPLASIHPRAVIGNDVSVGPFCVIEDGATIADGVTLMAQVYVGCRSRIGKKTLIYPHAVIREDVVVGANCILHAGCVLGSDGYGFYYSNGRHQKIPQIGMVIVEDDVEIGSCTTIDRATTGKTIIRAGTKIDNLVQIAHNVDVGENSLLVAQVGIAGSTKIGKGVVLAGQVGVADHVVIADGTQVGAQSGIKHDTKPGDVLFGSPAQPIQETLKQTLLIRKLPELFKDVKNLKQKIKDDHHD